MPLIACPACARPVSDLAPVCPGCGQPLGARISEPAAPDLEGEKPIVHLGYAFLFGAVLVTGVLAYVRRGAVRGTWLESHYNWQIATFWQTLALMAATFLAATGVMFSDEELGVTLMMAAFAATFGWLVYRAVRGWVRLARGLPAPGG